VAIRASTRLLCLLFLLLLALAGSGTTSAAANALDSPPNRVTLITDSVGGVLSWVTQAREKFARGLDLDLEAKACRKLVDPGCPQQGDPHPTSALATIQELGSQIGPTVVIDVGYNDLWSTYGDELDKVMNALVAVGVQHVVWVTLEEFRDPWIGINKAIRVAPKRWSQLIVADWAPAAADKPTWFYDGVHMNWEGGFAFADFLRPYVLEACGEPCAPPPPLEIATSQLPVARAGKPYSVTVSVRGGAPPLTWSVLGLPRGLHLNDVGRISGTPRAPGVYLLTFRLHDSWNQEATLDLPLRVRRRA
jgi:putative Ig domain-containing protein